LRLVSQFSHWNKYWQSLQTRLENAQRLLRYKIVFSHALRQVSICSNKVEEIYLDIFDWSCSRFIIENIWQSGVSTIEWMMKLYFNFVIMPGWIWELSGWGYPKGWNGEDEAYETLLRQWVDPQDITSEALDRVRKSKEKTRFIFTDYASI